MEKNNLRKGAKVWCWWQSRLLWYTGLTVNGKYKFKDICDEVIMVSEAQLAELEAR